MGLILAASADPDAPAIAAADAASITATEAAALLAQIATETDPGSRDRSIDRLVASRDITLAAPLLGFIRSDDIALRNAVIAALPLIGEPLLPHLAPLLGDADPGVRIAAANLLQGLRGPDAVALALSALAHEPHVNVCAALVDMLADTAGSEAIAPLEALAQRFKTAPFIAFAVAAAIARIG